MKQHLGISGKNEVREKCVEVDRTAQVGLVFTSELPKAVFLLRF